MWRYSQHFLQFITVLIIGGLPAIYWTAGQSYALELENRSVTISSAVPSALTNEDFQLTIPSITSIGSIQFEYCSNSPNVSLACTAPTGLNVAGASLSSQSGNTGFSFDNGASNANTIVITRTAVPTNGNASTYNFSNITNPSAVNSTTFIRITTYNSIDATGAYVDHGSVAFSTSQTLQIGAYVPPFLNLCVGITVSVNCSQIDGNGINLGLLSYAKTGTATSQFSASTNSATGYDMFVIGTTMTSGNNIIPQLTSKSGVTIGNSEFGINLRQNSNPNVGFDPNGNGTAAPTTGYDTPNQFQFNNGDLIADSPLPTDFNQMTVSYVVDVGTDQPAGIYSTTMTYMATAQF